MRVTQLLIIGFLALVLTACGQALSAAVPVADAEPVQASPAEAEVTEADAETAAEVQAEEQVETGAGAEAETVTAVEEIEADTDAIVETELDTEVDTPLSSASASSITLLPEEPAPSGAESQFSTDFSKHTIPYSEILSGGPPKDGIPAVDDPKFVSVGEADEWIDPQEPVAALQIGDEARAYPLQILIWHEIANDEIDGVPVSVTFCPLCNTVIAFDRRLDEKVLDFGTTGRLRFSNLVMYDRQTETWWQQATGDAIAGELVGRQLNFLPAQLISWEDFKTTYPEGQVLSRDTGFSRRYGQNPYTGYDNINQSPFLYRGPETPGELPAMARVITVELDDEAVAYPYDLLQEMPAVNDTVGATPIVVFWESGTASALDTGAIASGRDVGTGNTFSRQLDGQTLTFQYDGEKITDEQTGSEWNILGQAVSGELADSQLEPVVNVNHFWFSWAAFRPDTRVYQP
jgi:hypothetical protein